MNDEHWAKKNIKNFISLSHKKNLDFLNNTRKPTLDMYYHEIKFSKNFVLTYSSEINKNYRNEMDTEI